ncbi:hypothetical protein PV326_013642 [Microctonus aethiopoides]|nr:hypothetical protein PV326_013642 [Microctonus aethiopoides]
MSAQSSFHKNVTLLTHVVPPSKDFQKYFKDGMFNKPNTQGFVHVSHYLLTIYDEERFKRAIEWPIFDKRSEAIYRNNVRDFLTIVINENEDIACPSILTSHLVTASGTKFINFMWKLSQIVLRTYLKRMAGSVLGAPKSGNAEPLTKLFFKNTIAKHEYFIKELDLKLKKSESGAKEFAKDRVKSIEIAQSELFESKKRLQNIVENIDVHVDVRKRIVNTNDKEVIELWKKNIQLGTEYLRMQISQVKIIEDKSTKVNNLVMSLFSDSRKILDGNNLQKLNTSKLMELPLEPEAQVAIHHLYMEDKLVLSNFFILLNSILQYFYASLEKNSLPDLSECKLQIEASTEDLEKICRVIDQVQNRLTQMSNNLRNTAHSNQYMQPPAIFLTQDYENFNSILLKESPKFQFNVGNQNTERHDVQERLKLTPVEMRPRPLFARYKLNRDVESSTTPIRPKMEISRINFTDALLSPSSAKLGAIPKRITSTRRMNQSILETRAPKKYDRLFMSTRPGILANCSMASTSSWKASTFIEGHNSENIYNMSDLRAQLATTSSANVSLDLPTPIKFTPQCTVAPPNTLPIKDIEKPAFNSSEVISELETINEATEINIGTKSLNKSMLDAEKQSSKRLSISDLIERYKKVRDQSICTPNYNFEIGINGNEKLEDNK